MIKIRLGRKRDEGSLRPLTEKEIQKRLYGAYAEIVETQEKPNAEWSESPRIEKDLTFPPPKKEHTFSFPWKKTFSFFQKTFSWLLNFLKILLRKGATGWGIGIVAVLFLFAGIHTLNAYRAAAMKAPRPPAPAVARVKPVPRETSLKKPEVETPTAKPVLQELETVPPPVKPLKKETPPPPQKPYVIQVCTYVNETDAQRLADQLNQAHIPSFHQSLRRTNGKTFYSVFVGRFGTFSEAQAKLKEFREKPVAKDFPDSFVRAL